MAKRDSRSPYHSRQCEGHFACELPIETGAELEGSEVRRYDGTTDGHVVVEISVQLGRNSEDYFALDRRSTPSFRLVVALSVNVEQSDRRATAVGNRARLVFVYSRRCKHVI